MTRSNVPELALNDAQWSEIAKHSGLAEDARREIDAVIDLYRRFQANETERKRPGEIHRELRALSKDILTLLTRLERVIAFPDAHFALTRPLQEQSGVTEMTRPKRLDADGRLKEKLVELKYLSDWLAIASGRVEGRKRGPHTGNVYWLVRVLDEIRMKFTGMAITRSYKDPASKNYIEAACRAADRRINQGTIDAAMKDRISRRGRISS
jgi:hypothetical protein